MLASVLGYRGISDVKPTNTNYPHEAKRGWLIFRLSRFRPVHAVSSGLSVRTRQLTRYA